MRTEDLQKLFLISLWDQKEAVTGIFFRSASVPDDIVHVRRMQSSSIIAKCSLFESPKDISQNKTSLHNRKEHLFKYCANPSSINLSFSSTTIIFKCVSKSSSSSLFWYKDYGNRVSPFQTIVHGVSRLPYNADQINELQKIFG